MPFSRLMPLSAMLSASIFLCVFSTAYADVPDHRPPGFQADISKPNPEINIIHLTKTDTSPASPQSQAKWQAYNQPMRECVPGMTIMPSKNNKLFAFLFSNTPEINANVTVSIQGERKNQQCAVNFTEGSYIKACLLDKKSLALLMNSLLNPHLFNSNGALAKTLGAACQNSTE